MQGWALLDICTRKPDSFRMKTIQRAAKLRPHHKRQAFPLPTHKGPYLVTTAALTPALERISKGIPISEFNALIVRLGLTKEDFARKIGVSAATLSRRKKTQAPLDPEHSDRLMRFQRLFEKAVELFDGNEDTARNWLSRPARALNFQKPFDVADTETGAREVENLIGRLEYGVLT
jgi:putative toxin-antitoxin system antitoxin component (TIGR02293 family)